MEKPSFYQSFDIEDTAAYILRNNYARVALQFPDQLLRISVSVTSALQNELRKQSQPNEPVRLYVLADTTYGSCCADEIAAAHVKADCIIHYGHTCLSRMSKLPVRYVLGKAMIDSGDCICHLKTYALKYKTKGILVLFDLAYAHAIQEMQQVVDGNHLAYAHAIQEMQQVVDGNLQLGGNSTKIFFAKVPERETYPIAFPKDITAEKGGGTKIESDGDGLDPSQVQRQSSASFSVGGLSWTLPKGLQMEDIELFWIGQEGPALTNVLLTFNALTVVSYDPERKLLNENVAKQSKALMRRYYLVERAKDANIVGIVVGTLGVAGYQEMVQSLHKLLKESGKKAYILAMGKPNPAKLANFPECDIFVLVACAHTALLDSKEYMVPVITPFEAMMAWKRGKHWNGEYSLDFSLLREVEEEEAEKNSQFQEDEARFSFIKGSYVEEKSMGLSDHGKDSSRSISLARDVQRALKLQDGGFSEQQTRPEVHSGVEYFALRTFQGLQPAVDDQMPAQDYAIGQKGRAAAYSNEPVDLN